MACSEDGGQGGHTGDRRTGNNALISPGSLRKVNFGRTCGPEHDKSESDTWHSAITILVALVCSIHLEGFITSKLWRSWHYHSDQYRCPQSTGSDSSHVHHIARFYIPPVQ